MNYSDKLKQAVSAAHSTLCVGLDPNLELLPGPVKEQNVSPVRQVEIFLKKVIDVTHSYCAAYKPNLGFFEALGADGWDLFREILDYIPQNKIIIADAKRGDISSTAEHYARAFFETFDVDAVTLNPLMGFETLDPFLNNKEKGIYVLTLTSNPGAKDILLQKMNEGKTVSEFIAHGLFNKQKASDTAIGMVVGATKAPDLAPVINNFPESPLLIPGIGKQGGSVDELRSALNDHRGLPLINSSRSITYAGGDAPKWDEAVGSAAQNLNERLSQITQVYV